MEAEIRRISLVSREAEQHPFFKGAARQGHQLFEAFTGPHADRLHLFTPGQIEYVVWTLAAIPQKELTQNQSSALGEYAWALYRARHTQAAYENGWIGPRALIDLPTDDRRMHRRAWMPEGQPSYLKGKTLRSLLGERYPWLDDRFSRGADILVDAFDGDAGVNKRKVIGLFQRGVTMEIVRNTDHVLGKDYWRDDDRIPTNTGLQMVAGAHPVKSKPAPKPVAKSAKQAAAKRPMRRYQPMQMG